MDCPDPPPLLMLAVGNGGWSFALQFVDASDNPIDLTAGGLTPVAQFFQGNTGALTNLTVDVVNASSGQAAAIVPEAVVLSTLYPAPSARLLGGLLSVAPTPTFRLYAYLLDALGNRTAEQIIAIQPVDWRTADPGMLPIAPVTYIAVGPSGPQGAQGVQGIQGIPGGVIPYTGTAAGPITQFGVVASHPTGLFQASSADDTVVGLVVGIATVAASTGQIVTYVSLGEITHTGWTWSPGPVFFDNYGNLTPTRPTGGFAQQVATAISATTIILNLAEPEVIE